MFLPKGISIFLKWSFFFVFFFVLFYCSKFEFVIRQRLKREPTLQIKNTKNYSSKDEQNMQGTAGKVKTNWLATFSFGLLHMDVSVLTDRQTYRHRLCVDWRCTIEDIPQAMDNRDGWWESELENSVLSVWHDDDDDRFNRWFESFKNPFTDLLALFSCSTNRKPTSLYLSRSFFLSISLLFSNRGMRYTFPLLSHFYVSVFLTFRFGFFI